MTTKQVYETESVYEADGGLKGHFSTLLQSRTLWWVVFGVQFVPIVTLIILMQKRAAYLRPSDIIIGSLDILCIVMALLFYLSILRSGVRNIDSRLFLLLLFINTIYLFSDGLWQLMEETSSSRLLLILINVVYLICPIFITLIYWRFLDIWVGESGGHYKSYEWLDSVIKAIAAFHILLILCSTFSGIYFKISQDGNYERGNLYVLTIAIPFIMVMFCIVRILSHEEPREERAILLTYLIPPMAAAIVQALFHGATILSVAMFIFVALLYTNYYAKKESEIAALEHDLTKSRLRSLEMQINPHFLFNTLHSVAGLCDIDSQAAQEMIYRLADYMRDNFTDIEKPPMVTLREELVQLDHYLSIETMRFPDINIVKEIGPSDFMIPALSLQPLVENAIKHGMGRRNNKGNIRISSSETENAWVVHVTDDGAGLDEKGSTMIKDGHFGLENVRRRLQILCNGKLEISSVPGQGTTVRISIPKNSGGVTTLTQKFDKKNR